MAVPAATAETSAAWREALAAWLRDHRTYPDAARRDGIEGRVVVRFAIDRTGTVREALLERSSGSTLLDDAAIVMLRGAHLPAPPGAGEGLIALTLPIRYSLRP